MLLRSDRRYRFDVPPAQLWARIDEVTAYTGWWPWLTEFDGVLLEQGQQWRCAVQPPLPYAVRFAVTIGAVVPQRSVAAVISGDVVGTARLSIEAAGVGCEARLVAELGPAKQALRTLSVAARPLVRFGHNWVLDTAARQFREHLVTSTS